jgi:hypothetical protein
MTSSSRLSARGTRTSSRTTGEEVTAVFDLFVALLPEKNRMPPELSGLQMIGLEAYTTVAKQNRSAETTDKKGPH